MKRYVVVFIIFWVNLFLLPLEGLNRDCGYYRYFEEDDTYEYCYYCLSHIPGGVPDEIPYGLLELIPELELPCYVCYDSSVYLGYLHADFRKYVLHLKQQLEYSKKYIDCDCLWPECSRKAAQISNTAYLLFSDLISTTALSSLIENENHQKELIENPLLDKIRINEHGLTISFISQQFRFSDYYQVCRDIENFAISRYEEKEAEEIKDRLEDILEALYPKFFTLYSSCYKQHPNLEIDQEIRFMKLLVNDISGLEKTIVSAKPVSSSPAIIQHSYDSGFITANLQAGVIPIGFESQEYIENEDDFRKNYPRASSINDLVRSVGESNKSLASTLSSQSNVLLEQGTLSNDLLLYKEAIKALNQAIQLNPHNRNAYIERAMAYFETDQLQLALKDYESAKNLTVIPPFMPGGHRAMKMPAVYIPENKTEFSEGLALGALAGAKISAVEFFPSLFSSCRGVLNGLWAFACSPIEISKEMKNTAYAMGEYISNHSAEECLQCVVPELKELSLLWHKLDDYSRGQKIGFIIGKYGVDIFAPVGALKGASKVRALKRANTMYTLECCAASQAKQVKILEESIKRAFIRERIIVHVHGVPPRTKNQMKG